MSGDRAGRHDHPRTRHHAQAALEQHETSCAPVCPKGSVARWHVAIGTDAFANAAVALFLAEYAAPSEQATW